MWHHAENGTPYAYASGVEIAGHPASHPPVDVSLLKDGNADDNKIQNFEEYITEIREFDVPYHMRVSIDTDIRCGLWYSVHHINNEDTEASSPSPSP